MNNSPRILAKTYPDLELAMETISLEHALSEKMHLLLISQEEGLSNPQIVIQYSAGYRVKLEPCQLEGTARFSWFKTLHAGRGDSSIRRIVQVRATLINPQGDIEDDPMFVRAQNPAQLLMKITLLLKEEARIRIIPIPNPEIQENESLEVEGETK
jgi:hypothetical protein